MKKLTKLYFVRHGEVHNPKEVVYGRIPGFLLSETGKKEAGALGELLKTVSIRAIYASPLTRAVETASYIAKHFPDVSVETDERLLEIRSSVDGKPNAIMYARQWNFYTPDLIAAGGENLSDIWNRMNSFIRDVIERHAGEDIVAVSHGDPIMVVRAKHSGSRRLTLPAIRRTYVGHASGFVLFFEGKRFKKLQKVP